MTKREKMAAIAKHRGPIMIIVPLVDSILEVQVVKKDLMRALSEDPAKCDEILITMVDHAMYIDRIF